MLLVLLGLLVLLVLLVQLFGRDPDVCVATQTYASRPSSLRRDPDVCVATQPVGLEPRRMRRIPIGNNYRGDRKILWYESPFSADSTIEYLQARKSFRDL